MNEDKDRKFYGKYRGTVATNIDPLQIGRLLVEIPDVLGSHKCAWAMPAAPIAGQQMGIYAIPPIGAGVWIEFEQGDKDYPIWAGCYYGSAAEVPPLALLAPPGLQNILLQTNGQNSIMITDTPGPTGGIVLKSASGAMIVVNDMLIHISNGKGASIDLTGPNIAVNTSALVII